MTDLGDGIALAAATIDAGAARGSWPGCGRRRRRTRPPRRLGRAAGGAGMTRRRPTRAARRPAPDLGRASAVVAPGSWRRSPPGAWPTSPRELGIAHVPRPRRRRGRLRPARQRPRPVRRAPGRARPPPHRRGQAPLAVGRRDRRGRRSGRAGPRLRGRAARARSPSCASPTGSAARWPTCAPSGRPSRVPVLAKEFVVDARQLPVLRAAGADLVLLLASLHPPKQLARLAELCPRPRPGAARRGPRRARARRGPRDAGPPDRHQQPEPADPRGRPGPAASACERSCRTTAWWSPSRASASPGRWSAGGRSGSTPPSSGRR